MGRFVHREGLGIDGTRDAGLVLTQDLLKPGLVVERDMLEIRPDRLPAAEEGELGRGYLGPHQFLGPARENPGQGIDTMLVDEARVAAEPVHDRPGQLGVVPVPGAKVGLLVGVDGHPARVLGAEAERAHLLPLGAPGAAYHARGPELLGATGAVSDDFREGSKPHVLCESGEEAVS